MEYVWIFCLLISTGASVAYGDVENGTVDNEIGCKILNHELSKYIFKITNLCKSAENLEYKITYEDNYRPKPENDISKMLTLDCPKTSVPGWSMINDHNYSIGHFYRFSIRNCSSPGKISLRDIASKFSPQNNLFTLSIVDPAPNSKFETLHFANLDNLTKLTIESSNLEIFDAKMFENLPSLEEMHLWKQETIPENFLSHASLSQLKTLMISGVRSAMDSRWFLQENLFWVLEGLERLSIVRWNEKEREVPVDLFKNQKYLMVLALRENNLPKLQAAVFRGTPNLVSLDCAANNIESIDSQAFQGLRKLKYLYLNSQKTLKNVPKDVFGELDSLETLWLGDNSISSLPNKIFDNNPNLKRLDLSSNKIAQVAGMKRNFDFLDLSYNLITEMDSKNTLTLLSGHDHVKLNDNPIKTINLRNIVDFSIDEADPKITKIDISVGQLDFSLENYALLECIRNNTVLQNEQNPRFTFRFVDYSHETDLIKNETHTIALGDVIKKLQGSLNKTL